MPEPDDDGKRGSASSSKRKFKRIATYRDQVFFPEGHRKWTVSEHRQHLDDSVHSRSKLLLFLDIDHTILHSTRDPRGADYVDHAVFGRDIFRIDFANQYNAAYFVKFRPSFRDLVRELTPLYDFVLYTMGSRAYAEQVAMVIDEQFSQFMPRSGSERAFDKRFVIGNRIICREDHGQIPDKEYKKDVARFAPIDGEWCMVLDDTPEVWAKRDDVHRVPKYLFWPNPEKHAPGTNHRHSDATNNKINIWSKNSITSWGDDRSLKRQEMDNVLVQAIEICKAVQQCYYAQWTPKETVKVSAPAIYDRIRKRILEGVEVVFTGFIAHKNAKQDFHWKFAELFGARVSEQITATTTHLIGKEAKTGKIQEALRGDTIEIVHVNWLYQTIFNFGAADCSKFRMFVDGEQVTPTMHCNLKLKSQRQLVAMFQNSKR